jgi:glycerophosphoryl diester phosphodiesterase
MLSIPFTGPKPRVFGHRGAAGLAPENTLPSFALGLALGADVLELDVHASRDGVIVVMHDPTLERTTNGTGPVRERSWPELQQLDAGYHFSRDGHDFPYRGHGVRMLSLEELFRNFPQAACNIEIKQEDPQIVEDVVRLIRRVGAQGRVMLAAEHDSIMTAIRRHAGDIPSSFATGEAADFIARLNGLGFDDYHPAGCALQIPPRFGTIELVTAESVAAAHRHGLEVHVWTINQRDEMEQLLALGVDGIMSDLPGLARVTVDGLVKRTS